MLTIAGLGLYDEKDLTLRCIEAAKSADKVYIELYTNLWKGRDRLEKVLGRPATELSMGKTVKELKREDLEQRVGRIIEEAKTKDVLIFVPGDPLIATTHTILIEEAKKAGIQTKVIHNASIVSAIGETGLHLYKFGATATVPFSEKTSGRLPESVYDILKTNRSNGLHTLLLLDITPERGMTANEAIDTLLKLEASRKEEVFTESTEIVVFARAGSDDSSIFYGPVKELKEKDFGQPPMVIIVPRSLHFSEKEFLKIY